MKIYNIGSLNIDYVYSVPHFVQPGETLSAAQRQIFPGGKGLNQSVALARAGASVIHCGRIGEDGQFLKALLTENGADTTYVETDSLSTGHAVIQVDNQGQNCILLFSGANHSFSEAFIRKALASAQPGDILLLQNEISHLDVIFQVAEEKQMKIALNPSPFEDSLRTLPLHQVTWWLCNEIEGSQLTGETEPKAIMSAMLARYPNSTVILTLGKDGCMLGNTDSLIYQDIFPVTAVDTTAAGDTFTGYFLAMTAEGKSPAEAIRIASKASSIAVSRMGASVSVPHRQEVLTD